MSQLSANKIKGDVFRFTVGIIAKDMTCDNSKIAENFPINVEKTYPNWLVSSANFTYPVNRIQLNESKTSIRAIGRAWTLKSVVERLGEKKCIPTDEVILEVFKLKKRDGIQYGSLPEHFERTNVSDGFYRLTFSGKLDKITQYCSQCSDCGRIEFNNRCDHCIAQDNYEANKVAQKQEIIKKLSVNDAFSKLGTVVIVATPKRRQGRPVEKLDTIDDEDDVIQRMIELMKAKN